MSDLWPAIEQPTIKAPVVILREQAQLLGEKTRNIVEAEVTRIEGEDWIPWYHFAYAFWIVAPTLGNYRYRLFAIAHGIDIYPVLVNLGTDLLKDVGAPISEQLEKAKQSAMQTGAKAVFEALWAQVGITVRSSGETVSVTTKEQFLEILRAIFNTTKTKQVIQAILAQSSSIEGPLML